MGAVLAMSKTMLSWCRATKVDLVTSYMHAWIARMYRVPASAVPWLLWVSMQGACVCRG